MWEVSTEPNVLATRTRWGACGGRRTLLLLLSGLLAGCGGTGTSQSRLDAMQQRGVAVVGVADEPPFGYVTRDGAVTGLGPEIARAAFARLGVARTEGELENFDDLIAGVGQRRFDVIGAMMTVTPERCRRVAFAAPVFVASTAFAVRTRERRDLVDYASIQRLDARLGVLAGAVELGDAIAGGVRRTRVREFPDVASAQAALELGRVDALALTAPSIRQIARASGRKLRAQPSFFPVVDGAAVRRYGAHAFSVADAQLRTAFDRAVRELRDSGELARIAVAQGFTVDEVNGTRGVSWSDACRG